MIIRMICRTVRFAGCAGSAAPCPVPRPPSPSARAPGGTAHTLRTPACEMHGVVCLVRSAQLYAVRCDSRAAWTVAADPTLNPTADRDRGNANLGVSAPGLLPLSSVVCT